jgi:hypothetical protein
MSLDSTSDQRGGAPTAQCLFYSPRHLGGIKSSWRGNRIETGKNLNPVQTTWGGGVGTFGGKFPPPPKDA